MPTNAEPTTLLDTSAALALVGPTHQGHRAALERLRGLRLGLAGHASFETYSVVTRLPRPLRLTPEAAGRLLRTNFPGTVHLGVDAARSLTEALPTHQIAGGSVYDALVAAAALEHDLLLVSLDVRAAQTYRAIGVRYELLST